MIDLRSDTVTKPTPAMRDAMARAEVGDDVFDEDPTIHVLQETVSGMLGKEAGLYVPSGTMANQLSVKTHTQPGNEIILEAGAHIFHYEAGGPAFLSGVQLFPITGNLGVITAEQIDAAIRPVNVHAPQTRLIWIENTHNRAGGTIMPIEEIRKIRELADLKGLKMHLDGARLWNAHMATGIPLSEYARYFDSVSVCFSKGLGAPVGSMVLGTREFIRDAHRNRKIFGGGMRQAGIIAAGALYAVQNHLDRLSIDHAHAGLLANALAQCPGVYVDMASVQTNILFFDISGTGKSAAEIQQRFQKNDILLIATGPSRIRAVTHLDISEAAIDRVIDALGRIF